METVLVLSRKSLVLAEEGNVEEGNVEEGNVEEGNFGFEKTSEPHVAVFPRTNWIISCYSFVWQ
jgi:hypothetical protein